MKRRLTKRLVLVSLLVFCLILTALPVAAEEDTSTVTVTIDAQYGQTEARNMLKLINDFRTGNDAWYWDYNNSQKIYQTGLSELKYDYGLEAIAMQRAAEIAVSFSHTRPDGTSCFTAGQESGYTFYSSGENIAAGYMNANSVFVGWQESNDKYEGQGHRRNMLSAGFTHVGIAHVVVNGTHYWVQEFGYGASNLPATSAVDSSKSVPVKISSSQISSLEVQAPTDFTISIGEKVKIPTVDVIVGVVDGWPSSARYKVTVTPDWSISGDIVVKEGNYLKADKPGSCTLTANVYGKNIKIQVTVPPVDVFYRTHVQKDGWQGYVSNGTMAGTSGQAKRLEGINIYLKGNANLGIQYTTHVQSYGWLPWSSNGDMSGTEGEAKRLEAIKIQLTGADKDQYDVYYRVHAQSYGWLGWAKNGEPAGTAGYAKRLEGIQILVVEKGEKINEKQGGITSANGNAYIAKAGTSPVVGASATSATNPTIGGTNTPNVSYRTHVQTYGWQGWKYNGQMSGTSGEAKRLEGINIKLTNMPYSGGITYRTHVQKNGWMPWVSNGTMSGTQGEKKRLEAIEIKLTGEMANHYDVYYRVHAQSYGWLGWAKNGASAGTAGYAKRLEGIQIVLVPRGSAAPANNYGGIVSTNRDAYIEK